MKGNYIQIWFFLMLLGIANNVKAQTYCIPAVSSPTVDDDIRYVAFATMSNLSLCNSLGTGPGSIAGGYSNFTGSLGSPNLAGSVTAPVCLTGNSYTIAVGLTMCSSVAYNGISGAYIDYNHNGSFSDPGEFVWSSSYLTGWISPSYVTSFGIVTIPCNALPGLTRLRIWQSESPVVAGPCGSIVWGETEDYLINIASPTSSITITPSNPTVCTGGTVALMASGAPNLSWSGGISNGVPFSPTATAIYTVSAGTGSCAPTQTVLVTYNPPLTVAGPSTNICAGSLATLIANGGTTYSWSTGATTPSITVSPPVTTTYTLFGSSNTGCNTQGTYTVNVEDSPTVTAVSNPTNGVCPNSPLILTGTGATAYSWSGGVINGVAFTPTGPATYTVTGTNVCGSATAAISVSINPLPNVSASINNPTVCSGNPVILTGGGAATYVWTGNAGNVPNNVQFLPSATTNYTVKGTSALGCTATAVVGNTVLITPTVVPIATPTAICFGGVSTLSSVGATGYTWTPGTNLFAPTTTVSPPISTTYTLFRTNGVCSSSSTVNLVVNPLPLVNASATPSQVCAGSGINLVVIGPITNTWLPGGFTQANLMVYPNFSTTYTVTGSNGNCTATAVVPVIVNPSPTMAINSPTNAICQGNSVTLTGSGSAQTFTWLPSLNTNNTTEVVSPPTTTIITLSGTNSFGCTSSVTQLMLVNPVPDMSLAGTSGYICAGESATLSVVNQSTNVLYTWNSSTVSPFIVANPVVTTNYAVTGINTQSGCQNSNTITLSVFISTFSVISPTALCKGSTATLTAVGPATSYVWSSNNGNAAPSVTVSPSLTTIYSVTGFNGSCQNTETVSVIVNPLPVVTAVAAKNTICKFEVSTITGSGANSYSWSTGATTPILSFTLSVTTNYTLTGTDLNGCAKSVTVSQFVATCLGMEDVKLNGSAGINVYPNPNNGNFTVSSDVNMSLSITNSLGQVVDTITLKEGNKREITVSSLPDGIYFMTGQANGLKINKKVIVER